MDSYFGNYYVGDSPNKTPRSYEAVTATAGQTLITFSTLTYTPNLNQLHVTVNGLLQHSSKYSEASNSSIKFTSGLVLGDVVIAYKMNALLTFDGVLSLKSDLSSTSSTLGSSIVRSVPYYYSATGMTLRNKFKEMVSVADFGAIGDGTDETSKLQAALNSGIKSIYLPAGTYYCKNLMIPSNTRFYGAGRGSILALHSSASATDVLIRNSDYTVYANTNILIEDMVLNGSNAGSGASQTRTTELAKFMYVVGIYIKNVVVTNIQYTGMTICGSKNVRVKGCEFTTCGYTGTSFDLGTALWISTNTVTYTPYDLEVSNCYMHDNSCGALQITGYRIKVNNNSFSANKEWHIYSPAGAYASGLIVQDYVICGNMMDGVTKKASYGYGMKIFGKHISIVGNIVKNCDHGGIGLMDVHYTTLTGNVIGNVSKITGSGTSGIDIVSYNEVPNNINITGNTLYDDTGAVTSSWAMFFFNSGGSGSGAVTYMMVSHNCCSTSWTSGNTFNFGSIGSGCKVLSNTGPNATDITT